MTNPREAPDEPVSLGLPIARGDVVGASYHRVGFDETQISAEGERAEEPGTPLTSAVPPSYPDRVPRESLAEQAGASSAREGRAER